MENALGGDEGEMVHFFVAIIFCLKSQITWAATDCRVESCRYVRSGASGSGASTGWLFNYGDGQVAFSSGLSFTTSYWVLDGQTGGGAANAWLGNFGFKITETGDGNAIIKIAYTGTANNITIRHVDLQGKGRVSTQGGS